MRMGSLKESGKGEREDRRFVFRLSDRKAKRTPLYTSPLLVLFYDTFLLHSHLISGIQSRHL